MWIYLFIPQKLLTFGHLFYSGYWHPQALSETAQCLTGGLGIMMDDVVATHTNAILHIIYYFYNIVKPYAGHVSRYSTIRLSK
jgi:phosphatidylglycerophosphatase A